MEANRDLVEVGVVVPRGLLKRMAKLVAASGVTLDAFFSASLELRAHQHAGRTRLLPDLEEAARRFLTDNAPE